MLLGLPLLIEPSSLMSAREREVCPMSGHPVLPAEKITLPLLPLRDVVVFPHMVIPLFVGRPKSIKALEVAMEAGRQIMLVAQKAAGKDDPKRLKIIYEIGMHVPPFCRCSSFPDGTVKVLVEGSSARAHQRSPSRKTTSHFTVADVTPAASRTTDTDHETEVDALRRADDSAVRSVRKAEQEDSAGDTDLACGHRRGRPSRGHDCCAPAAQARAEAIEVLEMSSTPSNTVSSTCSNSSSKGSSTSSRWKSASAGASSVRWRRASASITSTSR